MTKEELEKENDKLILGNKSLSEKVISVTREKLDLQKENKELREKYLQATDEGTSWAHLKILERENEVLKKINTDSLSELNHINGDLLIENEKLRMENTELKEQHYADCKLVDKTSEIIGQLAEAKDIIERLLINRPDTYSGTYVELIQSKMFEFNRAVSDADDFLKENKKMITRLEKEAEECVPHINWHTYTLKEIREAVMLYYRKGAEPRERRIEELEKENGELIGKVAFLENDLNNAKARIEKMKECANCPTWLLNQTEKNCRDCKYKEVLILLRK